jgi:acetolactate synthase-1/2/3 large subunit
MRVSDYILQRLYDAGVTHSYSVTGRGALFLTDALAKQSKILNISNHHEQASGFSAVAHSQYTGELSLCLVSTGCASTNAITPVLSAWQDGVPTFFLSGQNVLNETSRFTGINVRTYGQQEADIVSMVEKITKYSVMLTDANDIGLEMDRLIYAAMSGRKGPVWLDVPLDIQSVQIEPDDLLRLPVIHDDKPPLAQVEIDKVCEAILNAKRPLILIGHGIRSGNAIKELRELQDSTGIPLVYTASAPDVIGSSSELSLGSVGMMGCSRAGAIAVQSSDLVLILGSRLNTMTTGANYSDFARGAHLIAVDIDSFEYQKKGPEINQLIICDVKEFLGKLNENIECTISQEWSSFCDLIKQMTAPLEEFMKTKDSVDLYQLSKIISENILDDLTLVTDSGLIELIVPTNVKFKEGQRSIHPVSQGAMGYALPAAIGAFMASGKKTLAIIGDGSIMMNLQELQTISHNQIPIKMMIVNNNAYSIIRKRQLELFRGRTIGTDSSNGLSCPSFEDVASCFKIPYLFASNVEELSAQFSEFLKIEGPSLFEISGVPDQDYIQMSTGKNNEGKLVRLPIEDQAPYLESKVKNSIFKYIESNSGIQDA